MVFLYDENNKKIEQHEFNKENKLIYKHSYDYSNPDGKIQVKIFDKNNILIKENLEDFI